jgi:hypothetical protein
MRLHLKSQLTISAPAQKVWRILAHEFDTIGLWASAIATSQVVPDLPAPAGAQVGGRICSTAVPGFAAIQETFTSYDEAAMHFAYQATQGRPWFLKRAENQWTVHALGPQTSLVEVQAELDLGLFLGLFLAPLLRLQMSRVGARSLEELKYYVERDQVHPRKLKAQHKRGRKQLR